MRLILAIAIALSLGGCAPLIVGAVAGGVVAHQMNKPHGYYEVCDRWGCRLVPYR